MVSRAYRLGLGEVWRDRLSQMEKGPALSSPEKVLPEDKLAGHRWG